MGQFCLYQTPLAIFQQQTLSWSQTAFIFFCSLAGSCMKLRYLPVQGLPFLSLISWHCSILNREVWLRMPLQSSSRVRMLFQNLPQEVHSQHIGCFFLTGLQHMLYPLLSWALMVPSGLASIIWPFFMLSPHTLQLSPLSPPATMKSFKVKNLRRAIRPAKTMLPGQVQSTSRLVKVLAHSCLLRLQLAKKSLELQKMHLPIVASTPLASSLTVVVSVLSSCLTLNFWAQSPSQKMSALRQQILTLFLLISLSQKMRREQPLAQIWWLLLNLILPFSCKRGVNSSTSSWLAAHSSRQAWQWPIVSFSSATAVPSTSNISTRPRINKLDQDYIIRASLYNRNQNICRKSDILAAIYQTQHIQGMQNYNLKNINLQSTEMLKFDEFYPLYNENEFDFTINNIFENISEKDLLTTEHDKLTHFPEHGLLEQEEPALMKTHSHPSSGLVLADPYRQCPPHLFPQKPMPEPYDPLLFHQSIPRHKSKVSSKIQKKINKELKKQQRHRLSLAERNIKLNFGTGFIGFIQFLIRFNQLGGGQARAERYSEIMKYLQDSYKNLRSFQGWQEIWNHPLHGHHIRKLSVLFFKRSFVSIYLSQSKIKKNYLEVYFQKVNSFHMGAKYPSQFTSFNFRNTYKALSES